MRKFLLAVGAWALCYSIGYGQNTTPNCPQSLRLASSTYDQGRLHEVQSILDGCLKSGGFSDQEKESAYRLLSLTYLYLEEPEQADAAMLELLRTNPYFLPNDSDPAEFIALYKTFRTRPIYRIGLNVGVNATQPNIVNVVKTIDNSTNDFKYKIGFQFGVNFDLPVTDKLTLNAAPAFQQKAFQLTSTSQTPATDQQEGTTITNSLVATSKQSWIAIPITVQYSLLEKSKYNPYIAAGISADLCLGSDYTGERSREGQTSVEPKSFDYKYQTKPLNLSAVIAAGSKVRVGGGFIVIEAKLAYGLTSITNENSVYQDQDFYLTYGMPVYSAKLNTVSLTAGYVQNIFNPKKLKRKK